MATIARQDLAHQQCADYAHLDRQRTVRVECRQPWSILMLPDAGDKHL
ncbi:MAG: hypothetical protein IPK19_28460 [Chloroflexi bacterium]|nr:hypothetical protein [Chloroflexota bacterium]